MDIRNTSAVNAIKGLKIGFDDKVAISFEAFITDEEFDDDTLRSDVLDTTEDDLEDCSVIEHLSEQFPKLFGTDDKQRELFKLLQNAIHCEWDKIKQRTSYKIVDPYDNNIVWRLTKQQNIEATQFMTAAAPNWFTIECKEKRNKALMDVVAIGFNNDFPLLNYLTDTYSRYKINNHYLNRKDVNIADWSKEYVFFKSFTNKKVLEKLNYSIRSFYRIIPQIRLEQQLVLIDDDINEFSEYFIAMKEAMETLIQKEANLPLQIDMMIIPKNVESSISKYEDCGCCGDSDGEDDEIGIDCIGNIEYRLDSNNFKYAKYENDNTVKMKRFFVERIESLINGKRNQRIIVYVDRRNPKYIIPKTQCYDYVKNAYGQNREDLNDKEETLCNKYKNGRKNDKKGLKMDIIIHIINYFANDNGLNIPNDIVTLIINFCCWNSWNDTIYFVQSANKLFSELPTRHSPETSLCASTQCMLPKLKGIERNEAFGCRHDLNGFSFIISWHIEAYDLMRCYWFRNCWGTRMIPYDVITLWPKHFKQNKLCKDKIYKIKNMQQINDKGFVNWYEKTTRNKLLLF